MLPRGPLKRFLLNPGDDPALLRQWNAVILAFVTADAFFLYKVTLRVSSSCLKWLGGLAAAAGLLLLFYALWRWGKPSVPDDAA
jgi:hypothetical protein